MVHPSCDEPAFGIDRIIWHVIDHAYHETEKKGEPYCIMKLQPDVAPVIMPSSPSSKKTG